MLFLYFITQVLHILHLPFELLHTIVWIYLQALKIFSLNLIFHLQILFPFLLSFQYRIPFPKELAAKQTEDFLQPEFLPLLIHLLLLHCYLL